jgi:hypothetical protein
MTEHTPTPEMVLEHPEEIPGYTYGTAEAATSPLTLEDLDHLRAVVGLTAHDEAALRDACTRPLDQAWLDYQQEIGLRHSRAKKNRTDHADSLDHIPMRYLLGFTAVVITSSRGHLAAHGASAAEVDRMHAAFTKSVMLHVTLWTRAYVDEANW